MKINVLLVPINDFRECVKITFPEVDKSLEELVNIPQAEITNSIGTRRCLLRHSDFDFHPFVTTEEIECSNIQTAIQLFNKIIKDREMY